jgi:hypothetical protein
MNFLRSGAAAQKLGIPYHQLFSLIRAGKLTPPPRDSAGDYQWRPCDIEAARKLLAGGKRRREIAAECN